MSLKDILIAIFISFIWGGNYVAMKFTTVEVPGFLSTSIRFLLTSIILIPFVKKIDIKIKKLYPISLVSGAYIGLIYYAMHMGINTYLGIILMQLNAVFSIIIANFVLKEYPTPESSLGIVIAFLGMIIVVGAPDAVGNYLAVLVILSAAVFCAIFSIKSKILNTVPPITLIFWTNLIAFPHLLLISYLLEGNPVEFIKSTNYMFWIYLFYSIIASCIFGISLRIYLLRKYPVYKVVPFNLLIPFFGFSFTAIIEKSIPSLHILLGGIVIICGISITQIKSKKAILKNSIS